ncbi:anaerobic glycerol-3-phosphate dehydrogenase subunit C [Natrarchaeobius halalkaliphilus]|uniref:Anaerobic glycerol-3-phosphate dehydrogenase subunit C n=1 Tax=Natrarchaeobius halalkaliphilus TaxID=1679091 RepID=A0A3N6LQG3_9EURY|nr:anaerobic glycerol-3-phosphate dehydrogenase subunit C [Natrarchaeobius halalkaliphilus]RQG89204.1 anaerobic glycerol-3-phosphate dehydrogenase subunit C [Natrarchaeobius halalkaliphilus]
MSDAEQPIDGGAPDEGDDEFEPIQVFPEAEEMDLRPGADDCYKCSTCDTNCPVAAVDDEFPGPKFQGPEQWRLKRQDDHDIDDSVMKCSNCMRCDSACPSSVPLSQMHNTARGEYVEQTMSKLSREYLRNRMLANYRRFAPLGATFPRTANFVLGLSITKWLGEKTLGITSERELPAFATETFREWWEKRGGNAASKRRAQDAREKRGGNAASKRRAQDAREKRGDNAASKRRGESNQPSEDKRIAYFHGCYSNYNTPEVGKALVRVYERFGYEVLVPDQHCSGTPMFANGMLEDARRAAETNVAELADAIENGADIIASCSSCSMSIRQEYPELFDFEGTEDVSANTWDAVEYLRVHEDLEAELEGTSVGAEFDDFVYHAPCHSRNQGLNGQTIEVMDAIDGIDVHDVGDSCSGISGTYGWKAENYETSMKIGEEMFEHMADADARTGLTECPTCSMQMEHGTGYEITHTLEVLEAALVGDSSETDG